MDNNVDGAGKVHPALTGYFSFIERKPNKNSLHTKQNQSISQKTLFTLLQSV